MFPSSLKQIFCHLSCVVLLCYSWKLLSFLKWIVFFVFFLLFSSFNPNYQLKGVLKIKVLLYKMYLTLKLVMKQIFLQVVTQTQTQTQRQRRKTIGCIEFENMEGTKTGEYQVSDHHNVRSCWRDHIYSAQWSWQINVWTS